MNYLDEYKVCKANSEEWARYHAIYRLTNFNEWMSLSFQSDINRYKKVDFCYWVVKGDKRVGGAFIKPNMIKCIFTIPPFHNYQELIAVLTSYVESISDKSNSIVIPDGDMKLIEYYGNAGFNLQRVDKLMVCPTKEFDVTWEERYKIIIPQDEHRDDMAKLYYKTYSKNKFEYLATQTYDFQVSSVNVYFNHISAMKVPNDWSTLIYDNVTDKFVGACAVGLVNELPYILDFVVHPEFQGKGLASKMIERTMNLFFKNYPAIRLSVTVGNDAEVFYDKLGFTSLAEKGYLVK